MSDGGKGSAQRPVTNRKQFEENWDAIFGEDSSRSNIDSGGNTTGNDVGDRSRNQVRNEKCPTHEPAERGT